MKDKANRACASTLKTEVSTSFMPASYRFTFFSTLSMTHARHRTPEKLTFSHSRENIEFYKYGTT
jgi:hypothetical protein